MLSVRVSRDLGCHRPEILCGGGSATEQGGSGGTKGTDGPSGARGSAGQAGADGHVNAHAGNVGDKFASLSNGVELLEAPAAAPVAPAVDDAAPKGKKKHDKKPPQGQVGAKTAP